MQLQQEVLARLVYLLSHKDVDRLEARIHGHQLIGSLAERQHRVECQTAQLHEQRVLTVLHGQLDVAVIDCDGDFQPVENRGHFLSSFLSLCLVRLREHPWCRLDCDVSQQVQILDDLQARF